MVLMKKNNNIPRLIQKHVNSEDFSRDLLLFFVLLILSGIRIWLAHGMPIYILATAEHDDGLFLNQAIEFLRKRWLGVYSESTLSKGISFTLFLAVCGVTRIPYTVLVTLMNIISAALVIFALKPLCKSRIWRGILFVILIFSPVTSAVSLFQRVYRNSLSASASLFLVAGCIYLFTRRDKKERTVYTVSILLGFALWFFMNLREDWIWMMPFIIGAGTLTILFLVFEKAEKYIVIRMVSCFVIPFIILFFGNQMLSLLNWKVYGVYTVNDRTDTSFVSVAKQFLSAKAEVDEDVDEQIVWVTRSQYENVVNASPTLSAIKDEMMQGYDDYAAFWEHKDVHGDFYVWALRRGASLAGHYEYASETRDFWDKVNSELQSAYKTELLTKKNGLFISFSSRAITKDNIGEILPLTKDCLISNVSFSSPQVIAYQQPGSSGTLYQIRQAESLTNSLCYYSDEIMEEDPSTISFIKFSGFNNHITALYQKAGLPIFICGKVAAVLLLVVFVIQNARKKIVEKDILPVLMIGTGLFLSVVILNFAVAWFSTFMDEGPKYQWWFYAGSGTQLSLLADLMIIGFAACLVKKIILQKAETKKNG